jgi:hypothetical protein
MQHQRCGVDSNIALASAATPSGTTSSSATPTTNLNVTRASEAESSSTGAKVGGALGGAVGLAALLAAVASYQYFKVFLVPRPESLS